MKKSDSLIVLPCSSSILILVYLDLTRREHQEAALTNIDSLESNARL